MTTMCCIILVIIAIAAFFLGIFIGKKCKQPSIYLAGQASVLSNVENAYSKGIEEGNRLAHENCQKCWITVSDKVKLKEGRTAKQRLNDAIMKIANELAATGAVKLSATDEDGITSVTLRVVTA